VVVRIPSSLILRSITSAQTTVKKDLVQAYRIKIKCKVSRNYHVKRRGLDIVARMRMTHFPKDGCNRMRTSVYFSVLEYRVLANTYSYANVCWKNLTMSSFNETAKVNLHSKKKKKK
jgi:hypothetical protein